MEVIPAIDIIEGSCVRLTKGAFDTAKVYSENPLEMAKQFETSGLKRLHVVDLDGAKSGAVTNLPVLERLCSQTDLSIDFGGGIKTREQLKGVFGAGADFVSLGSIAVKEPKKVEEWIEEFGAERFILAADTKAGKVVSAGWQEEGDALDGFISSFLDRGLSKIMVTDVERDGTLTGPATELYSKLLAEFEGLWLFASGGVSSYEDLQALQEINIKSVIVGKAFYEGRVSLEQLAEINSLS